MANPVTGYCACCRRQNAIMGPVRVPDGLPAANSVCGVCLRHLGQQPADLAKRERQHMELWEEDRRDQLQIAEDTHRQTVAALERKIADLGRELDERPTRIVVENLDRETVDQALDDREKAYRSRDRAFEALLEVGLDHRLAGNGRCSCGRRHPCDTVKVIAEVKPLKGWERKQWERWRSGQSHMLPARHPGVIDPRWRPETDSEHFG